MSLSHLPGGDALDAMLAKVSGSPGDIDTLVTTWQSVSGDIEEFAGGLSSAVQNVNDAWRGTSANHFNTYMHKYGAAAASLKTVLSNAASSLKDAATALRESHAEISSICADLSTSAATYEADHPDASAEDLDAGLTRLVNQAKSDAQPWVDSADLAVTKAKDDINRFLDERGPTFRGIPEVTKQDFIPVPGQRIDWQPDPSYQEQSGTTTQGYHGPPVSGSSGSYGSSGSSGPPPPGGGPAPTGQVKEWIEQAIAVLAGHDVPASKMNANDIWMIIQHESGGNPHAINNWDSNAVNGTPSKGLMQTIDPTFNAYALAGHKNIYDPVDNIIAGVRYAISRYGSVSNVPGVVNSKNGMGYVGY